MGVKFKDQNAQDAFALACKMHDTLSREGSGRGMAYRKGWNGHPYDPSWTSYPIYCAGRVNRKRMGGEDLPHTT